MTSKAKKKGPPIQCDFCGAEGHKIRGKTDWREPHGWLMLDGQRCCRRCKDRKFVPRTISLTVRSIEHKGNKAWAAFRAAFRDTERGVLRLKNWALTEFYVSDPIRALPYDPQAKSKLPSYTLPTLYSDPRAKVVCKGAMSAQLRESITEASAYYRKNRFALFLGNDSLRTMKSPTPVPFGNSWTLYEEDGVFSVGLSIGSQRFRLIIAGGKRHRRQLNALKRMKDGEIIGRSIMLHDLTAGHSQHRPLLRKNKRLVCKIAALIPKTTHRNVDPDKILYVSTGNDVLLRYGCSSDAGRRLTLNADHMLRESRAHRRRIDRLMDDKKRYPRGDTARRDIDTKLGQIREKHRRRVDDFVHKTTRMLIDFAVRNRCGKIEFDGTRKGFIQEFSWYKLGLLLEQKAEQHNLEFIASGPVVSAPQGALELVESS